MRECIFCSAKENLNKEDLWPQWLIKSTVGDRSSKIERTIGTDAPETYDEKYIKARCVCEPCNGGWMSLLETHSKPILEPMIHDSPCVLDHSKQTTVSLWTMKTSMVFEYLKRNDAFYSRADRQHLRKQSLPPPDTLIWVGRYEDNYLPSIEKHALLNPKSDVLGAANATTFAGRLAIQSFTTRRSATGEGISFSLWTRESPWDRKLIQIWPPMEGYVRWPPAFSITAEGVKQLAKRFWAG